MEVTHIHTYLHVLTQIYDLHIHTYMHTCIQSYMHTVIQSYMHICICEYVNVTILYLSASEMREHFQNLHPFLDGCDSPKSCVDHILYHHFQVFQPSTELVIVIMPTGGLHIEDSFTNSLQTTQMFLKSVFDLLQTASELWTATTTKTWDRLLFSFKASSKVFLHREYIESAIHQ